MRGVDLTPFLPTEKLSLVFCPLVHVTHIDTLWQKFNFF